MKRCGGVDRPPHTVPLVGFHKRAASEDGLSARCKECQAVYNVNYRATPEGKEVELRGSARYREKYPEKIAAHTAVTVAIRKGDVARAEDCLCNICASLMGEMPAKTYHHLLGYEHEHRLDVVPLCATCHSEEHRRELVAA